MAVTIDDIKDLHLDSSPSIAPLETLEVSHSLWHTPIRIVTNHADGVNAMLETGETVYFEFAPLLINRGKTSDDLDQSFNITLGDLGEIVPPLIKQIRASDSDEYPQVIYRQYAYDASSMTFAKDKPIDIAKGLFVEQMSRDHQATTFDAKTPDKNTVATGRPYSPDYYVDLKGLL
ncbi:DUF1833 family protein [Psychrobacter sp. 230]|uniref:DUF1833 family protein n=1 Tax=Psychrobacter sp. 230 TaxID=2555884 RepID=UPI001D0DAEEF|nr:DUF1833 family protein [Psychrobacter sp. 230]|tara:strand:- start:22925 stop:23452 length:528 start_codon:yes stop_codon:yes gene_type:complete